MPADIFVYALVAAGLVFWLRNVLGVRHGGERERHSPYLKPPEKAVLPGKPAAPQEQAAHAEEKIRKLAASPEGIFSIANKGAEEGLLEIARNDKDFDVRAFLSAAQEAFAIIVEAFAAGDRETLRDLLSPEIYGVFIPVIEGRESKGEAHRTEIHAVTGAEILEADIRGRTAYIAVRFAAQEVDVARDRSGAIIAGHPEKTAKTVNVWVFGRALRSSDPRWLVYETRGDGAGEEESVPAGSAPAAH